MYNKLLNELAVCSLNAVRAVAARESGSINRFFLREDRMPEFSALCSVLAKRKRPYKICADEELERISKTPHHQGVVAMIEAPEIAALSDEDIEDWSGNSRSGIVLHEIGNDFNVGAIIRQAAFFDVNFVLISGRQEGASLSTAMYRAAEGGLSFVKLRLIESAESFLKLSAGKMVSVGACHRARLRIGDLTDCLRERFQKSGRRQGSVIVIGNEESGLTPEIKQKCDFLFRIPGTGNIECLNVSQAAALFCHRIFEL